MPTVLESRVQSLDGVPEAYRANYKQEGDEFVLEKIEIPDMPDVEGLKKNASQLLEEKKKLQKQFEGVDLDEYKRLKDEAEKQKTEALKSEGKFDEIIEKWQKEKEAADRAWQERLDAKDAELTKLQIDDNLRKYAAKGGIFEEYLDDVVELHRKRTRRLDNGTLIILDEKGDPLDISIEKYFSDYYKEKKSLFYRASDAGGSGAGDGRGNGNSTKTITRAKFDQLSPYEQSAKMKAGFKVAD